MRYTVFYNFCQHQNIGFQKGTLAVSPYSYLWTVGGGEMVWHALVGRGWPPWAATQVILRNCSPPPQTTSSMMLGRVHVLHLDANHRYLIVTSSWS